MSVRNTQLLLIVVFVLTFVQNGLCITCYKCTTYNGTWQCGEPFEGKEIDKIQCPDGVCFKVKHPTVGGGKEPVTRGCYDGSLCNEYSVCRNCTSDFCNSSNNVVASFIVVLFLGLPYVGYYLMQ